MIKKLPPLSIYETARTYWPDIVDILRMINSDGRTFYSKNFRKLEFRERVITITEEAAKTVANYSTTIVEFYNDRYKVLMRYGDSTTPMSAELYVLFRNQDSNNKRVGYLKCNRGIITLRNMEPCDYSGEIIFKSIFMALPGPISYLIKKVTGNTVEILEVLRER